MRVLHVTPYFAPAFCYGGPPRTILGLCRALQKRDVDVEVFTTTANGGSELPESQNESDVYEGVRVRYFRRSFGKRWFRSTGLKHAMKSELGKYDLLHIHGLWNVPVWQAAIQARRAGIPYVISSRGMLEPAALAYSVWRKCFKSIVFHLSEKRSLDHAAFIHATSPAEAETIGRLRLRTKVVMLPHGIEPLTNVETSRRDFRKSIGMSERAPLLLFLGRVHRIKRVDMLFSAFERVRARYRDARLVIAGPVEHRCQKELIDRFASASKTVEWTGEIADEAKWSILADADALVMCSDSENFGMSVLEGMAAGVPVVVTKTCPWDIVEQAGSGFWVAQNSESIADALICLLDDPVRARAMGERGKILAHSKYGWDSIAEQMAAHYADCVEARSHVALAP